MLLSNIQHIKNPIQRRKNKETPSAFTILSNFGIYLTEAWKKTNRLAARFAEEANVM